MSFPILLPRLLLTAIVASAAAGCFQVARLERVEFPRSSINGRPMRLALDTGAELSLFLESTVKQAGIGYTAVPNFVLNERGKLSLSEPVDLVLGERKARVALPIARFSIPWYVGGKPDIDGLIGWPEVRDNLLHFDAATRTVRRIESVPAEALEWLRLEVLPRDILYLRFPTPDGERDTVFVDTGAADGIGLPDPYWTAWRQANAAAKGQTHSGGGAGTSLWSVEVFDNASATAGPIAVSNVPVFHNRGDLVFVGLQGLSRFDLIVDAANRVAYLKPAPPLAGAPEPVPADREWRVDPSVRVEFARMEVYPAMGRAARLSSAKDHPGALAEIDRVLAINPGALKLHLERGHLLRRLGRHPDAVAAFERAMAIDPELGEASYQRGFTRQMQGDRAGALPDYERYLALVPKEWPRAYLIRHVLEESLGRSPTTYATDWWDETFQAIARFVGGATPESEFIAAAARWRGEAAKIRQSDAYYFMAMKRDAAGDRTGAAEYFRKVVALGADESEAWLLATAELARGR